MAKIYKFTEEGLKKLQDELENLKTNGRKDIAERIKVARGYDDLSENSEYDDAKNEQAILEARIATVEATLKTAVIIDESNTSNEHVHLTSVVTVEYLSTGRLATYRILGSGSNDINPREGRISDESPIGKALMEKSVGDVVEVETPAGMQGIKVLDISK